MSQLAMDCQMLDDALISARTNLRRDLAIESLKTQINQIEFGFESLAEIQPYYRSSRRIIQTKLFHETVAACEKTLTQSTQWLADNEIKPATSMPTANDPNRWVYTGIQGMQQALVQGRLSVKQAQSYLIQVDASEPYRLQLLTPEYAVYAPADYNRNSAQVLIKRQHGAFYPAQGLLGQGYYRLNGFTELALNRQF